MFREPFPARLNNDLAFKIPREKSPLGANSRLDILDDRTKPVIHVRTSHQDQSPATIVIAPIQLMTGCMSRAKMSQNFRSLILVQVNFTDSIASV